MTCCPSEKPNSTKIATLIAASLGCTSTASNNLSMDFLHFIRYMNIVYKADGNLRLKFLYGVSINGIQLFDFNFSVLDLFEIFPNFFN
jgi:hypothetical protein